MGSGPTTNSGVSIGTNNPGAVGEAVYEADTTAAAQDSIGGTVFGKAIFQAQTTAAAQNLLEAGTVGLQIFKCTTTAAVSNIVGTGGGGFTGSAANIPFTAGALIHVSGADVQAAINSIDGAIDRVSAASIGGTAIGKAIFTAPTTAAAQSLLEATAPGLGLFKATTTAAQQNLLEAGAAGLNIFKATTTAAAQNLLEAGTVGLQVFKTTTTAAALNALGGGTVGIQIFGASTTAAAGNFLNISGVNTGDQDARSVSAATTGFVHTSATNVQTALQQLDAAINVTAIGGGAAGIQIFESATTAAAANILAGSFFTSAQFSTTAQATAATSDGTIMSPITTLKLIQDNIPSIPYGQIGGFIISSISGSNSTASFSIAAGGCTDATGASYITKSTSTSWAATNGNAINGTDAASSTLANSTTYHVFMCKGASGVGSFVSSSLSPTLPTGYNSYKRRIGSFQTNGSGSPVAYSAIESEGGATVNYLTTQVLDLSNVSVSATLAQKTVSVPSGIKHQWMGRITNPTATGNGDGLIVLSGDETDVTPAAWNGTTVPLADMAVISNLVGYGMYSTGIVTTNTSGQIGLKASSATPMAIYLTTRGWKDFRRS